jgi:hypothetical protein
MESDILDDMSVNAYSINPGNPYQPTYADYLVNHTGKKGSKGVPSGERQRGPRYPGQTENPSTRKTEDLLQN